VLTVSLPEALRKAAAHEVAYESLRVKCEVLETENRQLLEAIGGGGGGGTPRKTKHKKKTTATKRT
jgi:hypothetical protein